MNMIELQEDDIELRRNISIYIPAGLCRLIGEVYVNLIIYVRLI